MSAPDKFTSENIARAAARVLREGAVAALATIVEEPPREVDADESSPVSTPPDASSASSLSHARVGAKLLVEESGAQRTGGTGDELLDELIAHHAKVFLASRTEARTYKVKEFTPDEVLGALGEARVLFERIEEEPHVVVCGAGHVGASLARLARAVGYRVTLIDDRADFVARERFPEDDGIELVAARNWSEPVSAAVGTGRGTYVAVVTRGHNEDEECMKAVLRARPRYVGMIGSRRRTNIVLERLRAEGFAEEVLREVRAPIGLDIGAVSPEEVALAVLAEIVAERRGGTGESLSAWRRQK